MRFEYLISFEEKQSMKHKNDEGLAKKCDISTNDPGKVCCTVRIHLSYVILQQSSNIALCLSRRSAIHADSYSLQHSRSSQWKMLLLEIHKRLIRHFNACQWRKMLFYWLRIMQLPHLPAEADQLSCLCKTYRFKHNKSKMSVHK